MIHALFYRIEFKRFSHDLAAAVVVQKNSIEASKKMLCFVTFNFIYI